VASSSFPLVHREFEAAVRRVGTSIAVQFGRASLRYDQLNELANRLAWRLRAEGVVQESRVAICLEPGLYTPVAVLGVLKAGGSYLPVDATSPPQRIRQILDDAGVSLSLTKEKLMGYLGLTEEPAFDAEWVDPGLRKADTPNPDLPSAPERIAYILYTSGSSGTPKGVMVSHRSLSYYLRWHRDHLHTQSGETDLPLTSSICFAAGVTQLYTPLLLGRTLHILPAGTVRQPELLFDWYARHPDFGIYCVPTLWSELLAFAKDSAARGLRPVGPKCAFLSGEPVTAALIERSRALWPDIRLWNLYGPTEATANGTAVELLPGRTVSLGTAINGSRIYLVDESMRQVDQGEEGEICISGPGVADGYVNRPELTAARFLDDPFNPASGDRLFRTGDQAKTNERGELIYIGRKDFQVKIRGYRVECGEIEQALSRHPAVRQAVADCRQDRSLEKQLVAWVTFHSVRYAPVWEIREFLAQTAGLPAYMIPERIVVLDSMPSLANGKIDRSMLPSPGSDRPELGYAFVPPATLTERILVRIWEEALGVEGVGANDDFFDLGGYSLKVAAAIARIATELKARVGYGEFFQNASPSRMARLVSESKHDERSVHPQPIGLVFEGAGRCGANQRSLWLLTQRAEDITAYNIQFSLFFDGDLDVDALTAALGEIVGRHDILRSVIKTEMGEPVLRIEDSDNINLETFDLRDLDDASAACEIERYKSTQTRRTFSLNRAPLYRLALLLCSGNRAHLVMTVHHVIFDGVSIGVFCEELLARYRAQTGGAPYRQMRNVIQYVDYLGWLEGHLGASQMDELVAFWREELEGCPAILDFPTDFARPRLQSFNGDREARHLSSSDLERLTAFSRECGVTPFMTMLAVYVVLLHRYTNQDDILVGCPVAGRAHPDLAGLLGFFTNTIVLRTRPDKEWSFRRLLDQVRETCLRAFENQRLPFEGILDATRPRRSVSHPPLFQVMFALHEELFSGPVNERLRMKACEDGNRGAKYDFVLDAHPLEQGMELRLTYNTDLFAPETMQNLLRQFVRLLDEVLEHPDRKLGEYRVLSADESRRILTDWNRTSFDNARDRCLHRLVEDQAARTPDRIALLFEDQAVTYAELNRRANQLAHRLIARGVERETPVGVRLDISPDLIVALLAIMKSGGTYVPLDPYYPRERISYVVEDSGLSLIVSQRGLDDTNARHGAEYLYVDLECASIARESMENPEVEVAPGDLAYVMYTSGSTGKPKGVMVPHLGPCNYVLWMKHRFPLTPDDRVLNKTSANFDISVWEIFLPLISGAQLVLGSRSVLQDVGSLADLIRQQRVTQIQFVPSALRAFVDSAHLASCVSLRRIFSGGEALSVALQEDVFASFGGELHNLYGPTEASVYVCHWECRRGDRRRLVPIGRPVHNSKVYILDEEMRPTAVRMTGELYIGGDPILARGYWNKPDVTAAKFVADPWPSDGKGARLFRTGDLARYDADGNIEFLGRADTQVKVRGYRIELGEIEHNLIRHPQVKHAIVIVREDQADDLRLVAYMLYRDKSGPDEGELRDHLKQKLPDYMIPSTFVELTSIPLLPNNKIDVKALPKPSYRKRLLDHDLERNYSSNHERTLAQIWEELLATTKFGLDDNFFDVGGHSLLMVKLQTMIGERLKIEVSSIDLFQYPTIRSLAGRLSDSGQRGDQILADMAARAQRRTQRMRRRT
jgi:amino acid adenylation domain-containing protein